MGRLDADGYLYIVDRIKDLIIRGGYNVYPRDVEDVLVQHPDVVAAAIVGRPDEKYGEEVVAFVQLAPGAWSAPAELVEFARQHLSAVKYPREVRIVDGDSADQRAEDRPEAAAGAAAQRSRRLDARSGPWLSARARSLVLLRCAPIAARPYGSG